MGGAAGFNREFVDERLGVGEAVFAEGRLNERVDGRRGIGALGPAGCDQFRQLGELGRFIGEVGVAAVVGSLGFNGQRLVGGERYFSGGRCVFVFRIAGRQELREDGGFVKLPVFPVENG